jgi:hypothetical protein
MSELKRRWNAPTPEFFQKVIKISLSASAGAAAILGAQQLGQMVLPGFTYTLLPIASMVLKNIFVAGLAAAAIGKLTQAK